jgi:gas vesicle protein
MLWIVLIIGLFLGAIAGIFIVALCLSAKKGAKLEEDLLRDSRNQIR